MTNIDLIAKALAASTHVTGKFGADEHKAAMSIIAKESKPEDLVDNLTRIGNISAVRQEGEKCGALASSRADLNALQRAWSAASAALKAAKK